MDRKEDGALEISCPSQWRLSNDKTSCVWGTSIVDDSCDLNCTHESANSHDDPNEPREHVPYFHQDPDNFNSSNNVNINRNQNFKI